MTFLLRRFVAAFLFAAAAVHAASMSPDPTGYWFNPNESGWGAAIAQQNDVLFVTLLVYDEQKRPVWFVAPAARDAGNGAFSGALYRTSGSPFGAAFDPAAVDAQPVGTLSLRYAVVAAGQASMRIDYSVNGVAVTKTTVRMTWESDFTRLVGSYVGGMTLALSPVPQSNGCLQNVPAFFPGGSSFRITASAPSTIAIIGGEGIDLVTLLGGAYQQSGRFGTITGGVFRGNIVSPLRLGDMLVSNLVVTEDGFVGHIVFYEDACVYEGTIGGIRRPG